MAKSVRFLAIFFFALILLASIEVQGAEATLCQRRSPTWSGVCVNSNNCDRQCRNWEKAFHGACHWQNFGFACFCYFKIQMLASINRLNTSVMCRRTDSYVSV
ncbi:hypothetical protein SLEP1_g50176 [Rubroshorea leprosula]|uniref:Knottins-like domain-containing protein n=1 Tax=Rubroshorea leprosula TaxID=152421 RepID=A0AAV5M025_9ROSI|nr:hypothetical protein SLEP1_g50176 [Rubroshorea leprosula]